MKTRRQIIAVLGAGFLIAPRGFAAEPAAKVHRVGHLSGSGDSASKPFVDAFREGMLAFGLAEGKHWLLDERYADGKTERLPALARELINNKPDVLLVSTTPANIAAKAATSTISIVMVLVADPVGTGIVTNLARPGGNITGITNIAAELAGKRLEIIREIVPAASRVAVLVNLDSQNAQPQLQHAFAGARKLGIELGPVLNVRRTEDLEKAFQDAVKERAAAAIRMIDPLVFILRRQTATFETKYRLPVIYPAREDAEAGGLVSYGADIPGQYRQAATFVSKILRGVKPAELPVEQPTKFELVINMKTARTLGLTIPQSILVRADKVIE